ncbi:hypothetical protein [Nocardia mangyaensis]|uniref:hypothetical protein n=1 Tax=Nocardia mangyaensis TaxID=2213200 RepID=UPI0026761313|nr:hypothetical protein [Nocardia mangyaensis]MDO3648583.1 hypothetical protein [Nocardia mangyaensis]
MSDLALAVLPLIRTRADLHHRSAATAHGRQMQHAVDLLADALDSDPATVFAVTQKALASAIKLIARADDSSGVMGSAIRDLLDIHARSAAVARVQVSKLVSWMIAFQFEGEVDYFELDPVAYTGALGEDGMASYRDRIRQLEADLGPGSARRFFVEWNLRRLAVVAGDVDAIIATHARDRRVAAWFTDTARALAEVGEVELAIDWARQAADFDRGHQAQEGAQYWCELLGEHRVGEELAARVEVFTRWPSSTTAARLYKCAGDLWPRYRDDVLARLAFSARETVLFALGSLGDVELAWDAAHALNLTSVDVWDRLVAAYEPVDPAAVVPVLADLVTAELAHTGVRHYQVAARYLRRMRALAAGTPQAAEVDHLIGELREKHRRRPRLQQEFDRVGLPR